MSIEENNQNLKMNMNRLPRLNITTNPQITKPKAPQTSRTITLKKLSSTQPVIHPPISSRFNTGRINPRKFGLSSMRLRPMRTKWNELIEALELFCKSCYIDSTQPFLMTEFHELTREYENFNKQAAIIFNSIHPLDDKRSSLTQSAIMQASRGLISEWADFIIKLNDVTQSGTDKQLPLLVKFFDDLNESMHDIASLFLVGSLKSDVSPQTMQKIYGQIAALKREASIPVSDNEEIDYTDFCHRVSHLTHQIESIFKRQMPKYRTSSAEVMIMKTNLASVLNELNKLVDGILFFQELDANLQNKIEEMNKVFVEIFEILHLPFDLKLMDEEFEIEYLQEQLDQQEQVYEVRPPNTEKKKVPKNEAETKKKQSEEKNVNDEPKNEEAQVSNETTPEAETEKPQEGEAKQKPEEEQKEEKTETENETQENKEVEKKQEESSPIPENGEAEPKPEEEAETNLEDGTEQKQEEEIEQKTEENVEQQPEEETKQEPEDVTEQKPEGEPEPKLQEEAEQKPEEVVVEQQSEEVKEETNLVEAENVEKIEAEEENQIEHNQETEKIDQQTENEGTN